MAVASQNSGPSVALMYFKSRVAFLPSYTPSRIFFYLASFQRRCIRFISEFRRDVDAVQMSAVKNDENLSWLRV